MLPMGCLVYLKDKKGREISGYIGDGTMIAEEFREEIARGQRFEFGKNWQHFLSVLDDERIAEAERSLKDMLAVETLAGQTFLDIGSGSGLFSLAALRLGAKQVHSFDYDPQSVACTRELKRRYFPNTAHWTIERGSALDRQYLDTLGQWDIGYSWGVLHHTGDMWSALKNADLLVRRGGMLFISIYDDQRDKSRRWRRIKRLYNKGTFGRRLVSVVFIPYFILRGFAIDVLRLRNPLLDYREYKKSRGMSKVHDWFDWLGGYPFEIAKPEEIFDYYRKRGYSLEPLVTRDGGCNEFVFTKQ